MKKGFSVIVNDKDEVIGGRHNEEVEMFQPIKHLSGDNKLVLSSSELLVNLWSGEGQVNFRCNLKSSRLVRRSEGQIMVRRKSGEGHISRVF